MAATMPLAGRYLSFALGGETYAVTVDRVEVVLEMQTITRVPNAAPFLCGVTNHRGSVIPVADPRVRFGEAPSPKDDSCSIIVLQVKYEGEMVTAGMLADSVREVIDIEEAMIEGTPDFGTRKRGNGPEAQAPAVAGIAHSGSSFIVLLDIDAIYASEPALMEA
jgi:purine-binding chemotaxis protein CheW